MEKGMSYILALMLLVLVCMSLSLSIMVLVIRFSAYEMPTIEEHKEEIEESIMSLFGVDEIWGKKIYIRNVGGVPLRNNSLVVYIDDVTMDYKMAGDLSLGGIGYLNITDISQLQLGEHDLLITGRGMEAYHKILVIKNTAYSVLYLEFNEGSGSYSFDLSSYGNDVSCSGDSCPSWVSGINGTALRFNPDDGDYMITPVWGGFPQGGQEITYSAWIYIQDNRANVVIVGFENADDTALMMENGYLQFAVYNDTYYYYQHPIQIQAKKWYYIQGSYENGNIHLYVNNIGQHWYDIQKTPRGSQTDRIIIGAYSPTQYFFHGTIDDVRVYNQYLDKYDNVSMVLKR